MNLIGKRLGKLVVVGEEYPPADEPKRFKYAGKWFRVVCECGTEKLLPRSGIAHYRSCGCSRYDHLKTTASETIRYTPNRTPEPVKVLTYLDL